MQTDACRVGPPSPLLTAALGFQKRLIENPGEPNALTGMALVALATGQAAQALEMACAAVRAAPESISAWIALGQAHQAAGDIERAEEAYLAALRLDGMDFTAHVALGELRLAQNRPAEAREEFACALRRNPALAPALMGLGNACALAGQDRKALTVYEYLLTMHPHVAEGEFGAGFVLARLGRPKEAEQRYRRALALRPDFAAAWLNLGIVLREQGRTVFAFAAAGRATEFCPEMISAWVNLAQIEQELGLPEEAQKHLRRAFALNPEQVETLVAWCHFRSAEGDAAGAWRWLQWSLARDPEFPEALNMQGVKFHLEGRLAEAVEVFERAEAKGHAAAASNRGNTLLEMGRFDAALEAQQKSVEAEPECVGSRYNLALTRLRLGDWERGWADYEARWRFREVHRLPVTFREPRWLGEPLEGRTILLHAEQGLGDTIQFCRYATLVAARGGRIVLEAQEAAVRLLRSMAVVRGGLAQVIRMGEARPAFDLECPLMSLPAVFSTTPETVPWAGAYLGAPEEERRWKLEQLPTVRDGVGVLRVGLAWAGNPK